jgi:putative glutamine amidotransferase
MTPRPIIGITLDSEPPGGYSAMPWYALRRNYGDAVAAAGGLPMFLPHQAALAEDYLDRIDALVVTGGAFDVDPALFGEDSHHPALTLKPERTAFELTILKGALTRDLPILGICGGQQALNVALGGTLIQHIPDEVAGALAHEQPNPRTEPSHAVEVLGGTRLAAIVGAGSIQVNSAHHQAVKRVAPGCVVDAVAPDGVIEGIEATGRRFCIGVQWHPEYLISPADGKVLAALVEAARQ